MAGRAYTDVRTHLATVGNRWLSRSWSPMLGVTEDLVADGETWCAATCPEVRLLVDDTRIDLLALPEKEVSVACDDHGASLMCRHAGEALQVVVTTTALHAAPALWRRVEVLNKRDTAVRIEAYAMDALALSAQGAGIYFGPDRSGRAGHITTHKAGRAVALQRSMNGLLLGIDGHGIYSLATEDAEIFALTGDTAVALDAHGSCYLPDTFVAAYSGGTTRAYGQVLGSVLMAVRQMRDAEAARAAALRQS